MSHKIVKFTANDDGDIIPQDEQVFHLSYISTNGDASFCSGEFYGFGESSVQYTEQTVESGGITCHRCLEKIKTIQSIKLEAQNDSKN